MGLSRSTLVDRVVTAYLGWVTGSLVVLIMASFTVSITKAFSLSTAQTVAVTISTMAVVTAVVYLLRRSQHPTPLPGIVLAFIVSATAVSLLLALALADRPSLSECKLKANTIVCP